MDRIAAGAYFEMQRAVLQMCIFSQGTSHPGAAGTDVLARVRACPIKSLVSMIWIDDPSRPTLSVSWRV
jgi:hypothetical protein